MIEVRAYIDGEGNCPFRAWFRRLDVPVKRKVQTALARMEQGNLGNHKRLQGGVLEHKIDFGPGYRIYFGRDGEDLIILLGGGSKKGQSRDIANAQALWGEYRRRG